MVQKISLGQQVVGRNQRSEIRRQRSEGIEQKTEDRHFLVGAAFSRDSNNFYDFYGFYDSNDLNDLDQLTKRSPLTVHGSPLTPYARHFAQPLSSYLAS